MRMWHILLNRFPDFDAALAQRFLAEGVAKSTTLASTIIVARLIGITEFGQLSQIQAGIVLLVPLTLMGLNFAIIRQISTLKSTHDTASSVLTCFLLVTSAVSLPAAYLWFNADEISKYLSMDLAAEPAIQGASLLLVCTAWQTLILEAIRARQRTSAALKLQVSESFSSMALILGIALAGQLTPLNLVLCFTLVKLFIFLAGVSSFTKSENLAKANLKILPFSEVRIALGVGVPLMLAGFGEVLMGLSDRLLIGRELGADALGQYVIAQTLVGILASWGAPYWWLLYPRLAKALDASQPTTIINLVHRLLGGFIEWGTLVAAMIIILGPLLTVTMVGQEYLVNTKILIILLFGVAFNQISTPWEYALYVQGRTIILMWATLFWGLAAVLGMFMFLPDFGLLGACCVVALSRLGFASTILGYGTSAGSRLLLMPTKTLKRALIGVLISLATILILNKEPLHPIVSALLFSACYTATVIGIKKLSGQPSRGRIGRG